MDDLNLNNNSLVILQHPLVQHKLTLMRSKSTDTNAFRKLLKEITLLMGYEITRFLPTEKVKIQTPLASIEAIMISGKKVVVVPILRAGLVMAEGLLDLMPSARVGHIGLYRDKETKQPIEYLVKLPDPTGRIFIVVDPMLATGNSAVHALDVLNKYGVEDSNIRFLALVAAPEGVNNLSEAHPEVAIYTAALDSHLNKDAYIVPGLGDAGDRLFGTR